MAVYNGAHSITFGDGSVDVNTKQFVGVNTWTDWHLIPVSRPTMAMPGYEPKLVQIPGKHGTLDLSEYLTGKPVYGDRQGSFKFYVDHESYNPGENWMSVKFRIIQALHGKRVCMCLSDDPGWYYEGRFTVGEWDSAKDYSTVSINYQVYPYKTSIIEQGAEDIIWDTFNFETDYDYYPLHVMHVTQTQVIPINALGKIITIKVNFHKNLSSINDEVTVTTGGTSVTVDQDHDIATLGTIMDEEFNLGISGSGYVTISFRERSL